MPRISLAVREPAVGVLTAAMSFRAASDIQLSAALKRVSNFVIV